jgi:signal transduction histidine kinase
MPIDAYMDGIRANIAEQNTLFAIVVGGAIIIVFVAVSLLITRPLHRIERAIEQMDAGDLSVNLSNTGSSGEILDLERKFSSMAGQLRSLYANLEGEVADRTRQLAEANYILEEQSQMLQEANELLVNENQYKSDFLATMSHELRTPLTSILAFTEIWERSDIPLSPRDHDALLEVRENGQLLLNMVNNILEVARIDAGHISLTCEYVDMVDLLSTVEGTMRSLADKRGITFTTSVTGNVPLIYADWEKLRRIIDNLTSNAIKFTQRGGSVSIEVALAAAGDAVCIRVQDTGIGIPANRTEEIFERFVQLDKSSYRRYSGSGLGLAVVKELVEIHHGKVEVQSVYKQGSTFIVTIPLDARDEGERNENHAG